jgi:hypothetical protein
MREVDAAALDGWAPARIRPEEGGLQVDWCHLGEARFSEPFFDETLERRLRHPFALLMRHRTSMDVLLERQRLRPGLAPSGLIFHMSRCGSTLLSQMLAALPWSIVVSEAAPVDTVLRAPRWVPGLQEHTHLSWLRAVVAALGQARFGQERAYFLKLDAWHTLQLPLFERAFPGVPWVFVYREPVEVLASHQRKRGAHMVPGVLEPSLLGLEATAGPPPLEEYGARVLARICQAGLDAWHTRSNPARLVSYRQLPQAVEALLQGHFGQQLTEEDLQLLRQAAARDAKNPVVPFEDDTARKEAEVTPGARALAGRLLQPLHEALERSRLAG